MVLALVSILGWGQLFGGQCQGVDWRQEAAIYEGVVYDRAGEVNR